MKLSQYDLVCLMLEDGFHFELVNEMRPWLEKVTAVRRAIFLNATDRTKPRTDQRYWMEQFEQMIVDRYGEQARFLPAKKEAKVEQAPGDDSPGTIRVVG